MKLLNMKVFSLVLIALMLSACGANKRPVYQGAEYYKNLEIPPDLTAPDTGDQLAVPRPSDKALQRFRDNNKLETVITPKFDGVRMVNYAGESWLEIDNNVEYVWGRLLEFWQTEGIELAQVRPLLGFMETKWIKPLSNEDSGFFSSLFQSSEPDRRDKFRVRVERFDHDRKTRLYIAHSAIEREVKDDDFIWVTLPSDLEAEREMLSRMGLFAGLNREQIAELMENYRPYSSLVEISRRDDTALRMTGGMDFVWRRAIRALDRLEADEINPQPQISEIDFTLNKPDEKDLRLEGDELSRTSWLMKLFEDAGQPDNIQYRLLFSEDDGKIKIEVRDKSDRVDTDEDGFTSGSAVIEQIRDALARELE